MSNKKKGDRRERQAVNILKDEGYTVEKPNGTPYPQPYGVDFFGEFDFVAFKQGQKPLWGQVKLNGARGIRSFYDRLQEIQFQFKYGKAQYWVCHANEGWRILHQHEDGEVETIIDERDMDCNMGEGVAKYIP